MESFAIWSRKTTGVSDLNIMLKQITELQRKLTNRTPEEVIAWAIEHFGVNKIALSSSMSAEDQVITDMLLKINPQVKIFTLDTGRLPQETYEVIAATEKHYQKKIEILFPNTDRIESMVNEQGPNLFYDSIENRKLCCQIRKIEPLKRKLHGLQAWICGLRRDQALTRIGLEVIEWDKKFEIIKINPIVEWNEKQVWEYIHKHQVPYNILHDQGYPSIGCACCTRAIAPGEELRAGRWWWEKPEDKECGLHLKN